MNLLVLPLTLGLTVILNISTSIALQLIAKKKPFRYWSFLSKFTHCSALIGLSLVLSIVGAITGSFMASGVALITAGISVIKTHRLWFRRVQCHTGSHKLLTYLATENIRDIRQRFTICFIGTEELDEIILCLQGLPGTRHARKKLATVARYRLAFCEGKSSEIIDLNEIKKHYTTALEDLDLLLNQ